MITFHLMSSAGGRSNNEDYAGMFQAGEEYCFALADGLGGHGKGEVASRLAVEAAVAAFAREGKTSADCLAQSFKNGQQKIREVQMCDRTAADMKTTCVLLHVGAELIRWGHIGDSRLYYFRNNQLIDRTLDHSVPQMLVAAGQLKEKHIRNHPDRNRLLRVMGIDWEEPKYQLGEPLKKAGGQAFLLCTDGFWKLITEKKMTACLKKADTPQQWLDLMITIVEKNGRGKNMDNYSAIAVWID